VPDSSREPHSQISREWDRGEARTSPAGDPFPGGGGWEDLQVSVSSFTLNSPVGLDVKRRMLPSHGVLTPTARPVNCRGQLNIT